ncbi:MAG: hypothetical protein IJT49_08725 [Clostridia bacterium]|nr:hypothetical protein [Clostridia bacterium]
MKKIITAVAVLFSVILCSCGAAPDAETLLSVLKDPYEAETAISDKDSVYTATVLFDSNALLFKLSAPELLCGVSYGFDKENSYIVYNGQSIPFEADGADDTVSGGVLVWKKLLSANKEYTARRSADQYVVTDGKTEYRFDKETKLPLYIKSGNITITFTNFKVKNDKTP